MKQQITGRISQIRINQFCTENDKREYVTAILTTAPTESGTTQELFLLSFFEKGVEYLKTLQENDKLDALGVYERTQDSTKTIVSILSTYTNNTNRTPTTKIRTTKNTPSSYNNDKCWAKIKLTFKSH